MTPKERVLAAINHRQPDRPPIRYLSTPEIRKLLTDYFKGQDLNKIFEVDFRAVAPAYLKQLKTPKPGSGIDFYDIWGTGYRNSPYEIKELGIKGTYPETIFLAHAELKTREEVEAFPWPNPDDFDYSVLPEQTKTNKDYAIILGDSGIPDIINSAGMRGRGMEQLLIDIITKDEVGLAIIQKRVDFWYEYLKRSLDMADGGIDIVHLGEDLGTQRGPIISPAMFDEFFKPIYKKFFDLGHSYGCKTWLHSCGSTRVFIPSLIEIGLDVLDSVQTVAEGMDADGLKKDFGNKLTFCGMIDTQTTLPKGTVEECRRIARHRIDVIGKDGGYIFCPSHDIQIDTPIKNILAVYEEVTGKRLIK